MIPRRKLLAAWATAALIACSNPEGTIVLSIATAPDSDLMERVERVRLTLSDPHAVIEAERGADGGFELALEVTARGESGRIRFEGFDADDELIAIGHAGPLPIASITVAVAIYVAEPDSLARAPVALEPARSELGAAPLVYGAVLAGGRGASGQILDEALIYNVHSHSFQPGEPLPSPRAAPALAARRPAGPVFIFGGRDEAGEATQTAWSFDVQTPPAGLYSALDLATTGVAREGAAAAVLGSDAVIITGHPLVEIDQFSGRAFAFSDAPPLYGSATATRDGDEPVVLLTGGDPSEARAASWRRSGLRLLEPPPALAREGYGAAALPEGAVIIVGGAGEDGLSTSAVRYDPQGDRFEVLDEFLALGRVGAAVAATRQRLLVAGGRDLEGALRGDAELFDAETLERIGSISMVTPRENAVAIALENGQILVAGGIGADGEPVATLELFTPSTSF